MCSPVRFSSVASGLLLGWLAVVPAQAQSLRVNGSASATVAAAPDYAAEAKGDPWDFDNSSDYVYTYSLGEDTPQDQGNEYTAWQPYPTVQNGIFSGVTREQTPALQMLFGGVPGAMNARQDTGMQDADRRRPLRDAVVPRQAVVGRRQHRGAEGRLGEGPARRRHAGRRRCCCWPRATTTTRRAGSTRTRSATRATPTSGRSIAFV